jgi:ketosteroid isomerase-like protein
MQEENVARQVVRLRRRRRRTLQERLFLRLPVLLRLQGYLGQLLPVGSRLRRAGVARGVRQGYEALNRGDMEVLHLGNDPAVEWHMARDEAGVPFGGDFDDVYYGPGGLEAWAGKWLEAWDEFRLETEEVIDCHDRLVVLLRVRVRGRGSNAELERPFAQILTLGRDGRAVRVENFWEPAKALEAVGLSE